MLLFKLLLPLLLLLPAAAQQPIGPVAGQVISNYATPPTLYTIAGHLLRSTDDGATWVAAPIRPLGSKQPVIAAVAADRTNPAVVYAATSGADGPFFKSTDRGQSWRAAVSGLPSGADGAAIHTVGNGDLYLQASNRLYRSRDGAGTWEAIGALPQDARLWDITRSGPSNQYAVAPSDVYRSTDSGATWTKVTRPALGPNTNSFTALAADPINPELVWIGERGGFITDVGPIEYVGVHRSGDGGRTWRNVHPRTQPSKIVTDPTGRRLLFEYSGESTTPCHTQDGGDNWRCVRIETGEGFGQTTGLWIVPGTDVVYVTTPSNLWVSRDAGETWGAVKGTFTPSLARPADQLSYAVNPGGVVVATLPIGTIEGAAVAFTTATSGEPWLTVTPASGRTAGTVTLRMQAAGLALGTHTATVRIRSTEVVNQEIAIPVSLTVSGQPAEVPQYRITTFAGTGATGDPVNGPAGSSPVSLPGCLTMDAAGNVWASLSIPNAVVRISPQGALRWMAGKRDGFDGDGRAALETKLETLGCALADGESYFVAEPFANRLRTIDAAGIVKSVPAVQRFTRPTGLALASNRSLYMTDPGNNAIRSLSPAGTLVSIAGGGSGGDGPAGSARLSGPSGIALDAAGIIYFTEESGHRVRKFDRGTNTITTIAGTGSPGYAGDGGKATDAQLNAPKSVGVDRAGNVYIADTANHVVRWISAATGNIYTIAGTGAAGFSGDNQPALQAQLRSPAGIVADGAGNVYVADASSRIRRLEPMASNTPRISAVVNGAGSPAEIAPGAWMVVTGANLAATTRIWRDDEIAGGVLPTELDGVQVLVNGKRAVVYFISPGQINALAPDDLGDENCTVEVVANGVKSAAVTAQSRRVSPSFFLVSGYAAARHYPDYKLVAKSDAFPGCADPVNCPPREAEPGETVLLYGTGFGAIGADGLTMLPVRLRFGGGNWTDAVAGLSSPGVYQVVARIPETAAAGDLEIEAEIGGRQSPVVKLPVRR